MIARYMIRHDYKINTVKIMQISVYYFASLRELMGQANVVVDVEENTSVSDLWQRLLKEQNIQFEKVMISVNAEYVKPEYQLKAADKVAFFPPVTGG